MNIKDTLSEKIAGEITLSPRPGQTIRKWRGVFGISQTDLANFLKLSPSVISDYESGRRKSPGIQTVKKIIEALVGIDEKHGGKILQKYNSMVETQEGVLEIMEYPYTIPANNFIKEIDGNVLTTSELGLKKNVKGFTLVDSVKTIEAINSGDYNRLYGWSTERAIIFTGIRYGRSPMIAIRVHPVKPTVVVYHRPGSVDALAIKLADCENIPLVTTSLPVDELKKRLLKIGGK
jgi:putative transcriptional regulator